MDKAFKLGDWCVEVPLNRLVRVSDPDEVVRIEPKAMQVLVYLASRSGEVVEKESLVRDVWEGTFVTNEVLTNAIWELRKALGDNARSAQFIETIPKKGYRLVAPVSPVEDTSRSKRTWGLIAIAAIVAGVLVWSLRPSTDARAVTRFGVVPAQPLAPFYLPVLALSPDGSRLVYASVQEGRSRLYLRPMGRMESSFLPGTEDGHGPFFSPDGAWIGFYADGSLRKLELDAKRPPVELAQIGAPRGASWGSDGYVYFTRGSDDSIVRVAESGGDPEIVTRLEEGEWTHRWPDVLPGAEAVLFTPASDDLTGFDAAEVHVVSLQTGGRKKLLEHASFARFAAGYLVYAHGGTLMGVKLDTDSLELQGEPFRLLDDVKWFPINGAAQFSLSQGGDLAYVPGSPDAVRRIVSVDRSGEPLPILDEARLFYDPALSADGSRLAVTIAHKGNSDLWVYEFERRTLTRITTSLGEDQGPVWSPDGERLAYYYSLSGPYNLLSIATDGSGEPEPLIEAPGSQRPECFSPDGRVLLYSDDRPGKGFDVWTLDLGSRDRKPLLATRFDERHARLSPDGQRLAYSSNESGRFEVYVTTFPDPGARVQISTDGGEQPVWDRSGQEIFYRNGDAVMSATMETSPEVLFEWRYPSQLLEGSYRRHFDVGGDGRLVMIEAEEDPSARRLNVVLNWLGELETTNAKR